MGVVVCAGGGVSRNAASIDPRRAVIITATGGQEITAALLAKRFYNLTLRSTHFEKFVLRYKTSEEQFGI